jgi:hypothetical protein
MNNIDQLALVSDHITKSVMSKLCNTFDRRLLISRYGAEIFKNPKNRCIRKTNLKSKTSMVHVGNNKWETALDKPLYSGLIGNIATSFTHMRDLYKMKFRTEIQNKIDEFVESMTCQGEHGDSSDREETRRVLAAFKSLVDELKIVLFNHTRVVCK